MSEPLVLQHRRGDVAVITLHRPEVRNAIDAALARALSSALDVAVADQGVRAIVLAGAGTMFCAGHDLRALAAGEDPLAAHLATDGYAGLTQRALDKPIVVAVQGGAFGGGLELVLSCDVIVLGATARMGLPEVGVGLLAAAGGVARLMQQLPHHVASWLIYSGESFSAADALRWGLANEVVDDSDVVEHAVELATRIAANAPLAVQASKRVVRALGQRSLWQDEPWDLLRDELRVLRATSDAAEGLRAFAEKRPPRFTGR